MEDYQLMFILGYMFFAVGLIPGVTLIAYAIGLFICALGVVAFVLDMKKNEELRRLEFEEWERQIEKEMRKKYRKKKA